MVVPQAIVSPKWWLFNEAWTEFSKPVLIMLEHMAGPDFVSRLMTEPVAKTKCFIIATYPTSTHDNSLNWFFYAAELQCHVYGNLVGSMTISSLVTPENTLDPCCCDFALGPLIK